MENLQHLAESVHHELGSSPEKGKVADYIPQLAKVPLDKFGIAVATVDGKVVTVGDAEEKFSIQSISKLFTLTMALGRLGDRLWARVDREPSGSGFNSIVQLEYEQGKPRNPFINAGAIAVTDAVMAGSLPKEAIGSILRFMRFLAGDDEITIDPLVARSEQATGHRNFALAHFMRSFDIIEHPPEQVLGVYFHQCAIAMTCSQLAKAGLFLAAEGRNPITGHRVVSAARARRLNSLMMMCGHYDGAGDFSDCAGGGIDCGLVAGTGRERQLVGGHGSVGIARASSGVVGLWLRYWGGGVWRGFGRCGASGLDAGRASIGLGRCPRPPIRVSKITKRPRRRPSSCWPR